MLRKMGDSGHFLEKAAAGQASPPSTFRLFDLPPELRNRIYRFAILEPHSITISAFSIPQQPNLLTVNKQITEEAIEIYYKENRFCFEMRNCDSTFLRKWNTSSEDRRRSRQAFVVMRFVSWRNLMEWLVAYYSSDLPGPGTSKTLEQLKQRTTSKGRLVVTQVFQMVHRMRDDQNLSWSEIAEHLESIHEMLVVANPAWLSE